MRLKLSNVKKIYENNDSSTTALVDITLNISNGECVTIIGKSGAGKSSLLNIIGLIDSSFSGVYKIDEVDVSTLSAKEIATYRNEMFGYIFQEYALVESDTVYENVKIPLLYSRYKKKNHRQIVENLLPKMGLEKLIDKKVKHLSGGERQRVAIARALINNPKIILADEPTGSLDEENAMQIMNLIYDYLDDERILILVTHNLSMIKGKNQRVITLNDAVLESDLISNKMF